MAVFATDDARYIVINGSSSRALGLIMAGSTPVSTVTPKLSSLSVQYSDGTIDTSRVSGALHYEDRTISYNFTYQISRYNGDGTRKTMNALNREVTEKISQITQWAYGEGNYKNTRSNTLYDTAYWNPTENEGYYFYKARCSGLQSSKVVSGDNWIVQFSISFIFDPYMYEVGATPKTFALFAGPTEDAVGMGEVTVRIHSNGVEGSNTKIIWCNDNNVWIDGTVTGYTLDENNEVATATARFTFQPMSAAVYSGLVGFYINSHVAFTYTLNGVSTVYKYRIRSITRVSGALTFIQSDKLDDDYELGFTQGGFVADIVFGPDEYAEQPVPNLMGLFNDNGGKVPWDVIWGTAKSFTAPSDQEYIVTGITRGPRSFKKVESVSGGQIYYRSINFEEAFTFDSDPFNELVMDSSYYGFYKLESASNLRRTI